jgi:hypothetical protein
MNISHRTGHLSRRRAAPRSCLPEGLSARPPGEQGAGNQSCVKFIHVAPGEAATCRESCVFRHCRRQPMQPLRSPGTVCGKPCRFDRIYGNLIGQVFRTAIPAQSEFLFR